MNKLLLPILALALLATACKKEKKNYDWKDEGRTVRLTDITWQSVYAYHPKYGSYTAYDTIQNSWHFEYDRYGYVSKLVQKDSVIADHSHTLSVKYSTRETVFQRDAQHRSEMAVMTYASPSRYSSSIYDYSYDAGNQLVKVTTTGANFQNVMELYRNNGRVTAMRNNSVKYQLDYNDAGNVTEIRSFQAVNSGRDTVMYIDKSDISYDGQPNYMRSIKGLEDVYSIWGVNNPQVFSENNMIRYGVPLADNSLHYNNISLQYNEYGYVSAGDGKTYTYEAIK